MLVFGLNYRDNSEKGNFRDIRSPYDGRIVGQVEIPSEDDVELTIKKADSTYNEIMKTMSAWKRAEVLYKVANCIRRDKEILAQTIAAEGGKPIKDARIEVARAYNTVKMSGDEALNLNGEQISMDRAGGSENHIAFTIKRGLGVVLAISAFNHPVNLICHQVATAFAGGNTVVVKPASQTSLSCFMICSYFKEVGLEDGIINVLPISGADTEKILSNPVFRFVTFIGSAEVGWRIPKLIAPGVGYSLEHGGTAVAVVDRNVDLELAAASIVKGAFYHAGQVCVSTQNLFANIGIINELTELILKKVSKLVVGNPNDDNTDVGPIINESEKNRILRQISQAVESGAVLRAGGQALTYNCIEPTILEATDLTMEVMNSEVFGPVLNINSYDKLDDLIELCNSTPFSFQNSIYTKNIDTALNFARKLDSKSVIINDSTAFRVDWMPFGGSKESGFRVGGIKYSINDLVEEKLIVIKVNEHDS
ncbi:MAG: aldehyde dehydrogenase family protein [Candidatus Kapabacteria bacterium]|nr:aldehyde dehydrogenase family protein [Candidatus Kapabacteria bacterium]